MGSKSNSTDVMLTEHVFEIRHDASGTFLDVRGSVADHIRHGGFLTHWKIDANVVNFRDSENEVKKEGAFAGYKSVGYLTYNPETKNFFSDRASKFWGLICKNGSYEIPKIKRFGARTKVFVPIEKKFDEINSQFYETIFSEKTRGFVSETIDDLQFILELTEGPFNLRIKGGPVKENEVANYMSFADERFNSCGLFLDIDFSTTTDLEIKLVDRLLKDSVKRTWEKIDSITNGLGI